MTDVPRDACPKCGLTLAQHSLDFTFAKAWSASRTDDRHLLPPVHTEVAVVIRILRETFGHWHERGFSWALTYLRARLWYKYTKAGRAVIDSGMRS